MDPVVWVLLTELVALLGLVARLRWWAARERRRHETLRERRRQETLRELAGSLANGHGGELEVDDVREDGSRLWVRLVATGTRRRKR